MEKLKIAMMSMTHGHTRKYYQVLKENPKLEWIAVSTANEDVKRIFLNSVEGIPCYDSDEEMLDAHPEIEAAVLASENSEHLRQMKLCAERGIHILSMKIPTFDMEEYDEMIRLCEEHHVVCQIELELHYNPVVARMKELVESGKIGNLLSFKATNTTLSPVWAFPWQGVPEKSYGKRVPLKDGDSRFRGGALCDHPHIFDMIRHVTGSEFDTLYASAAPNIRPDIEEEDMLNIVGRMKNGVIFSLDPSWSNMEERLKVPGPGWEVAPKRMEVNLILCGDKGTVMTDCFGPNTYHNGAPNDRYTVNYTYFDEWVGLIDEFVDNIRLDRLPKINLRWHRETVRVMNAVYDSIASGKVVQL
ncbi:MAG: Gfo/Idh/MocA family oxidoreductase [Ruminococcaceae bacterium]|jgi:predicted dehydrogenase|nr:Gfo/Idh/MocA family oxidoreductase [Oscillospiraceae bacterium]